MLEECYMWGLTNTNTCFVEYSIDSNLERGGETERQRDRETERKREREKGRKGGREREREEDA
jgi:hypothetical protein